MNETRVLFKSADSEILQSSTLGRLDAIRAEAEWVWVDVRINDLEDIERVAERFGFDHIAVEDVSSPSEFPKIDDYGDHIFLVTHALGSTTDQLTTVEMDAFLGSDFLVTFHWADVPAIEWVIETAQENPSLIADGADRVLARICEITVRRFLPLIDGLERKIEELEDAALASDPTILADIQALRRDLLTLRRSVSPQREVFARLREEWTPVVGQRARLRFGDVYDQQYRVVETLDTNRAMLGTILETYRSTVSERLNEVMKVLTVFSAILLPLSLLAGLYGMNFANIPELAWQWGYFALLGVMATIAVGLWIYFARRGFIGGPKLHKIPRVVGRGLGGLVHLTLTPLNVILVRTPQDPGGPGPPDI